MGDTAPRRARGWGADSRSSGKMCQDESGGRKTRRIPLYGTDVVTVAASSFGKLADRMANLGSWDEPPEEHRCRSIVRLSMKDPAAGTAG